MAKAAANNGRLIFDPMAITTVVAGQKHQRVAGRLVSF
jgi:hypothetical protein